MEEIQLIGSLPHYLQGFVHPRWCRISSINSPITKPVIFAEDVFGSEEQQKIWKEMNGQEGTQEDSNRSN